MKRRVRYWWLLQRTPGSWEGAKYR